jgi:ankyrin repeat protein
MAENRKEFRAMTFEGATRVIKRGDIVHLRKELDEGQNPNLCNQYSWTLLMIAAMEGDTSIGRLLIEKGADLDRRNNHRETALSLAAHTGHPSFVSLLLENGASLECYPFGSSIDVWLDWLAQYFPERMKHIRDLFDTERQIRVQRTQLTKSGDSAH